MTEAPDPTRPGLTISHRETWVIASNVVHGLRGIRAPYSAIRNRLRRLLDHIPPARAHRTDTAGGLLGEALSLMSAFHHPDGAGVIGPGTDGLLRTALVQALASRTVPTRVITTRPDLERLFPIKLDSALLEALAPGLHAAETLEEAIEHLESRSGLPNPGSASTAQSTRTLWLVTPGSDADVVHQTIRRCSGINLTGLFAGPWPYGPTHVIDIDSPRQPLHRPITLLSPEQAITALGSRPGDELETGALGHERPGNEGVL
ncbi:hypothetical protein [Thermomonospora cellulosilytica]|uniref:Uncharacterized protein n=1 Tax=Thermomonospora cellulosilytica TaxID=1411118 RepID=A0A7W3N4E3_9ACTN|nr:hypothetical protein [Thermomonospora cellulosilytica]MBA9007252.1 hypothetical protein [Thermomonospora cellulosilytica]